MEKSKYEIALEIADKFELVKQCKLANGWEVSPSGKIRTKDIENVDKALDEFLKRFEKILSTLNKYQWVL